MKHLFAGGKMKNCTLLTVGKSVAAMLFLLSSTSWSAHKVGNGGDYIRGTYIRMGDAIVDYLQNTEQGQLLVKNNKLDINDLDSSLDIEKIAVSDQVLRDNSGSVVEAIGIPDKVTLNKESWFSHFEKSRDIYYLVFHEMLRSAAINDDNYVISAAVFPFPMSKRIDSKIVPTLPLIAEDNLAGIFDLKNVSLGGNGCAKNSATRVEFDQERNILDVSSQTFRAEVWGSKKIDRKTCQLAIPVSLPKNKRLVISQIDLLGKVDISSATTSQLTFEAFLAGTTAAIKTRSFAAQNGGQLIGKVLTRRTDVLKSKCGMPDTIRLNSSVLAKGGSNSKIEGLSVDQTTLFLSLEDCI